MVKVAETVVSTTKTGAGTVVDYAIRSVTTRAGVAPVVQTVNQPYVVRPDGKLATHPEESTNSSLPVKYAFRGYEALPSIAELRADKSVTSTITFSISGRTAAVEKEFRRLTKGGAASVDVRMSVHAGLAPALSTVVTKAGTYRHIVGVRAKLASIKVLNANALGQRAFASSLGSVGKELGDATTYFAKGVGVVEETIGTSVVKLSGCSG
jgi:hypothetical protein